MSAAEWRVVFYFAAVFALTAAFDVWLFYHHGTPGTISGVMKYWGREHGDGLKWTVAAMMYALWVHFFYW
jgi:hypothetical protein